MHSGCDYQVIERYVLQAQAVTFNLDQTRLKVQVLDFPPKHRQILLLLRKFTNWDSDLGRSKDGRRDLVQKRLENVMITPVDQNYLGITLSKHPRRCRPGKSCSDNCNALSLSSMRRAIALVAVPILTSYSLFPSRHADHTRYRASSRPGYIFGGLQAVRADLLGTNEV